MKSSGRALSFILAALFLLAALLLRLNFILHHRPAPVVWDAAGYNLQAREFVMAFQAWPDREAFRQHFRKGYEMALPKCELYPLFLSLVYLLPGADFAHACLAQGLVGMLSCLLTCLIAARIFHRRVALLSLLLSVFYIPFILSEGRLLTETLAIFVLLLTTWLICLSLARGRWWLIFLAGFSTALLVISRTFFQYIFIIYWLMLLVGFRVRKIRWFLPRSLIFLAAFALPIVPRLFWTPSLNRDHRHLLSGSWRNGMAIYCGIYPPNQGLQTDDPPGGEILEEVVRQNRHRSADDGDYFRAYLLILLRQPAAAIPVLFSKGWVFWQRCYNDFRYSYLLSPAGMDFYNRLLLLIGLFGLPLLLGLGPTAWPVTVATLYAWGMCFLADAESRYTLPAMPFTIMLGLWFLERAGRGALALRVQEKKIKSRFRLILGGVCLLLALSLLSRPALILMMLPALPFLSAHALHVVLTVLFLISLIPLFNLLYRSSLSGWRRLIAAFFPPVFLLAVYLSALKVHPDWHQWKIRLSGETTVRHMIRLPENLKEYRSAELKMDMVSGPVRNYTLTVRMNGENVRRWERGIAPDPGAYIASRRAFPIYLREHQRRLSQVKQWFTIPLDIARLLGEKALELEVQFSDLQPSPGSFVDLFGDYAFSSDPLFFEGPTFSQSPRELSLYRYLTDDDWRLWREVRLEAPVASSWAGGGGREDDLSPEAGIQSGRYRIFLLLSRRESAFPAFPVAVRSEEYLTRRTHLANYYNLQVWEVNPWKRKGNRFLLEAAHAAAGERGAFSLVVYADTNGDGKPDLRVGQSPAFQAQTEGQWSSYEFRTEEKSIFVGMTWPKNSQTLVYYERLLWPDEVFPEVMYYTTGPSAAKAGPVVTNLRITFLENKQE